MVHAAKALVKSQFLDVPEDPDTIVSEFRTRIVDTGLLHDNPVTRGKFANYLFHAHRRNVDAYSEDLAHRFIEETQLFIEAAYACYGRMNVVSS